MLSNLKARFPQLTKLIETIEQNLALSITAFVVAILAIVSATLQSHFKDWINPSQPTINAVLENGIRPIRKGDRVSVKLSLVGDHNNNLPQGSVTVTPQDTSALVPVDPAAQEIDGKKSVETLSFQFIAQSAGKTSLVVAYDSHPKVSAHVPPIDVSVVGPASDDCSPTYDNFSGCWTLYLKGVNVPIQVKLTQVRDRLTGTYQLFTTPDNATPDGTVTGSHNQILTTLTLSPNPAKSDDPQFRLFEVSDPKQGVILCKSVNDNLPPNPTFAQACEQKEMLAIAQKD